jgi:hypothetical protein
MKWPTEPAVRDPSQCRSAHAAGQLKWRLCRRGEQAEPCHRLVDERCASRCRNTCQEMTSREKPGAFRVLDVHRAILSAGVFASPVRRHRSGVGSCSCSRLAMSTASQSRVTASHRCRDVHGRPAGGHRPRAAASPCSRPKPCGSSEADPAQVRRVEPELPCRKATDTLIAHSRCLRSTCLGSSPCASAWPCSRSSPRCSSPL